MGCRDWARGRSYHQRGFTLIEVLLSVAIIGILVGLSLPLYRSFQTRSDLDVVTQGFADALYRAQSYARSGRQDSAWSIHIPPNYGSFYLYKGSSFAGREAQYDETFSYVGSTSSSTLSDITFSKFTGEPTATGSVTITSPNNETRTVTINAKGLVTY